MRSRRYALAMLCSTALVAACADEPVHLLEPREPPAPPGAPRSYAVPLQMRTLSLTQAEWPEIAGCPDGHLAAISPDGTLTIADPHGDVRVTRRAAGRAVACSGDVVAVSTETGVRRLSLAGEDLGDTELDGTQIALASHPSGGFVVAYERGGDTHVAHVSLGGVPDKIAVLEGWVNADERARPIVARRDGAIALVMHGADQPRELLGVTLEPDLYTDSGVRELLVVLSPEGTLLDAIVFYTWGRLVELRGDDAFQALSQEITVGSRVRSLVHDIELFRVRPRAQRAAGIIFYSTFPFTNIIESEAPAMVIGANMYVFNPDVQAGEVDLKLWPSYNATVPIVAAGECRSFAMSLHNMIAMCVRPPLPSLAYHDDAIEDDDSLGWAIMVRREDLDIPLQ